MKFCNINKCLKCDSHNLLAAFPVKMCSKCKTIVVAHHNTFNVHHVKFYVGDNHIVIDYLENSTYLNGVKFVNFILPFDVSEDKLNKYNKYVIFS